MVLYDYEPPAKPGEQGVWEWELIEPLADIPGDVVLRILGSRRRTLFVEGTRGGLDHAVIGALFDDRNVEPCGGWEQVDRCVRAFNDRKTAHHLDVNGLLDLDDRSAAEVTALEKRSLYVLPVAGIENVLVLPECLRAVAESYEPSEREGLVDRAMARVVEAMKKERQATIAQRAEYAVRRRLHNVNRSGTSKEALIAAVNDAVAAADPEGCYMSATNEIDTALAAPCSESYLAVLRLFRNKAILAEAASVFKAEETPERFKNAILEKLAKSKPLRDSIRAKFPAGVRD